MAKVGVMGAGSWGTALALLLHSNGHQVTVWSINEEEVEHPFAGHHQPCGGHQVPGRF